MEKYHPLYAYAIVSVVLILGIQMMLTDGTAGITGFAVGDQNQQGGQQGGQQQAQQQGGQGQGAGQQGAQQQADQSQQKQGFFQKVGGFFGIGDNKDTTGQATGQSGTQNQQGQQQGGQGQTSQQGAQQQAGQTGQQNAQQQGQQQPQGNETGNYSGKPYMPPPGNYTPPQQPKGNETGNYTAEQQYTQPTGEQQISDESKACLDAIDEEIKSCTKDAVQTCLDNDEGVDCIMEAIGSCMDDYKDDKDGCFEEKSE